MTALEICPLADVTLPDIDANEPCDEGRARCAKPGSAQISTAISNAPHCGYSMAALFVPLDSNNTLRFRMETG
jgi:hypothetical protein